MHNNEREDRRMRRIGRLLDDCLNWQERCALTNFGPSFPKKTHKKVADTAEKKRQFLFDALACCLADFLVRGGERPHRTRSATRRSSADCHHSEWAESSTYIAAQLGDDDTYFMAYAFAKLFRALLSTRALRWHMSGTFDYFRVGMAFTHRKWIHAVFCSDVTDRRAPRPLAQT